MVAQSMAPPHSVLAFDHRPSVLGRAEEVALPVAIEEEQVPERATFASELEIRLVPRGAIEDQVGKDALLLLPEVLGRLPCELCCHAPCRFSFHAVEDAAADVIETDHAHSVRELTREIQTLFGALLQPRGLLRLTTIPQSFRLRLEIVRAPRQVPRNLQVVPHHRAVLLPLV